MDNAKRLRGYSAPHGTRGFIVSHPEFDHGNTKYRQGRINTNQLALNVEEYSRVDIKFHYINLEVDYTTSSWRCKSQLKFDSVLGYTDNFYFNLCATQGTVESWDYYLYPVNNPRQLKFTFLKHSQDNTDGGGFLLEFHGKFKICAVLGI